MIEARLWLFLRQYLKRPILGISLIHEFVHGVLLDLVMMMTAFSGLDLANAVMRLLKGFLKKYSVYNSIIFQNDTVPQD